MYQVDQPLTMPPHHSPPRTAALLDAGEPFAFADPAARTNGALCDPPAPGFENRRETVPPPPSRPDMEGP